MVDYAIDRSWSHTDFFVGNYLRLQDTFMVMNNERSCLNMRSFVSSHSDYSNLLATNRYSFSIRAFHLHTPFLLCSIFSGLLGLLIHTSNREDHIQLCAPLEVRGNMTSVDIINGVEGFASIYLFSQIRKKEGSTTKLPEITPITRILRWYIFLCAVSNKKLVLSFDSFLGATPISRRFTGV